MFNGTDRAARRSCSVSAECPRGNFWGKVAEHARNSTARRYTSSRWKLSMFRIGRGVATVALFVAVAVAVNVNVNVNVNVHDHDFGR